MEQQKQNVEHTPDFTWGIPIKWIEVEEYSIIKYHPWKTKSCNVQTDIPDTDKIQYHGWIDGKNTHESWPSFEACIAGLIAEKYAGANNGGAGYYFCKMVDAPPYDKSNLEKYEEKIKEIEKNYLAMCDYVAELKEETKILRSKLRQKERRENENCSKEGGANSDSFQI